MRYLILIIFCLPLALFASEAEIYTLENGIEVVLIENHAAPVIASSVIVRTGLRDEAADIIGASHFLEHLLFNGTIHRTQEELYEEMDLLGGYNNAHTGENFTNYVILMDREHFEKGLEIQTDMLFNSTLPNQKFVKERGIVIEEIGQSHDRTGYMADIHFCQRFFKGTPYAFQVLGNRTSIENMKRSRMMEYYRSHYLPNNMTAIITGDFDPEEIKAVLDEYLGAPGQGILPEREAYFLDLPERAGIAPVSYHRERTESIYLRVGLPAPHRMGEDYYPAEILSVLLDRHLSQTMTGGDKPLAQSVSLEYFSDRDFGAFVLRARLSDADDVEPAVEAIRRGLGELSRKKILADEIKNFVTAERVKSLMHGERPHFFAMMKAHQLAFHGYEFVESYYDKLLEVTPKEVKSMAGELFQTAPFLPVAVIPYSEKAEVDTAEVSAGIFAETLPNGMGLVIAPGSGSGIFAAHFLFKNRSSSEPPGKAGITNFLHNMLLKGTVSRDKEALGDAMNALGMRVEVTDNPWIPFDDYRTTPEYSFVRMETATEYWREALTLTAEIIKKPSINPGDVEAIRGMLIGAAARESKSASAKSKAMLNDCLFGSHVLAMSVNGDMRSLSATTREDLVEHHDNYISPYNLILSIVGDPPAEEIADEVIKLFGGSKPVGATAISSTAPTSKPGEYRESLGKKQSYIRLGYLIDEIPEEDEAPLRIAAAILSDKMAFQLRERQGLAYSLGALVGFREGWGYFTAHIGTGPENIETALTGMKEQIAKAAEGRFTEKEVTKAVNSYLGRRNMRLLTSINRASYLGIYTMRGEPLDTSEIWAQAIKSVTANEVNRCAKEYFKTDDLVVVVVE